MLFLNDKCEHQTKIVLQKNSEKFLKWLR